MFTHQLLQFTETIRGQFFVFFRFGLQIGILNEDRDRGIGKRGFVTLFSAMITVLLLE